MDYFGYDDKHHFLILMEIAGLMSYNSCIHDGYFVSQLDWKQFFDGYKLNNEITNCQNNNVVNKKASYYLGIGGKFGSVFSKEMSDFTSKTQVQ